MAGRQPAATVRNNSDFPEPVVPATRKCGPSAFRSIRRTPDLPVPTGVPAVRPPDLSGTSAPECPAHRGEGFSEAARQRHAARGAAAVRRVPLRVRQKWSKTRVGTRSGTKSVGGASAGTRVPRRPRTMRVLAGHGSASTQLPSTREPRPGRPSREPADGRRAAAPGRWGGPRGSGRHGHSPHRDRRQQGCGYGVICGQRDAGKEPRGNGRLSAGPWRSRYGPLSGIDGKLQDERAHQTARPAGTVDRITAAGSKRQGHRPSGGGRKPGSEVPAGYSPVDRQPEPQPDARARRELAGASGTGTAAAEQTTTSAAEGAARRRRSLSSRAAASATAAPEPPALSTARQERDQEGRPGHGRERQEHPHARMSARPTPTRQRQHRGQASAARRLGAAGPPTTSGSATLEPASAVRQSAGALGTSGAEPERIVESPQRIVDAVVTAAFRTVRPSTLVPFALPRSTIVTSESDTPGARAAGRAAASGIDDLGAAASDPEPAPPQRGERTRARAAVHGEHQGGAVQSARPGRDSAVRRNRQPARPPRTQHRQPVQHRGPGERRQRSCLRRGIPRNS